MRVSRATRTLPLVLVVDDDLTIRMLVREALELAGFAVEEVADGIQALSGLDRVQPDVVLMDVMMPEMDGFTACAEIRKLPEGERLPVVMMTGLDDIESINRAYEVGATDFITKPLNWVILGHRIHYILRASRAFNELRKSTEQYRALMEASSQAGEGVVVIQDGGQKEALCIFANEEAIHITGYPQEKLYQTSWMDIVHQEYREGERDRYRRRLSGERFSALKEIVILKNNGQEVPIEITSLVTEFNGQAAVVSFFRDISERKKAEQEMISLEEQLRQSQKMEAIGQLAGGIAHDFNNSLTLIKVCSQLALLELKEGDPLREKLAMIEGATERSANLARQLLAFSRRQVMEMKILNLNDLLRDLDKMLRRVIGEDIELVNVLAEDLGRVKADPGQIEQVILNLALNARDAMPKGGKLTIETANAELDAEYARSHVGVVPGRYVMLAVSDTGEGMTPEVRARVFEPFFTTKKEGKGTGLGLSSVYGIVKQSKGCIWVYSEPGIGSIFKVYLPLSDESSEGEEKEELNGKLPRGGETILVVEDDREILTVVVHILKRQGYKVLEAVNGGEALLRCGKYEGSIQLMVTDVVMPGMSGRELAERLLLWHPEMNVLYMSGYTDNSIVHHGVLDEGVNFIQKPFSLESLAKKIREILDK